MPRRNDFISRPFRYLLDVYLGAAMNLKSCLGVALLGLLDINAKCNWTSEDVSGLDIRLQYVLLRKWSLLAPVKTLDEVG